MATLTGQTVKGSYKDLLQVSNSNSGIDATARAVSDGEATASLLYLSTTDVYSPGKAGTSNTVFGKTAGAALLAASTYNVLIGEGAGNDLTTADSNVAIGYNACDAMTTSEANVGIGHNALGTAIIGNDFNIAIGYDAMVTANHDSTHFNIAIGAYALDATTTNAQSGTIAIGHQALTALTSGAGNMAIGHQAMTANVDGTYNLAVGYKAQYSLKTGDHNTAIGVGAQGSHSDDDANTSVGYDSLRYTYGGGNVAVGKEALKGATFSDATCDYDDDPTITHDSNANIVAGLGVSGTGIPDGAYIATRTDSTHFELSASTTGGAVTNGTLTFYSRTTGAVAIGTDALTALTAGIGNVAVGHQALLATKTSDYNVAVGASSLAALTGDGSTNNVAIGHSAGMTLTVGGGNILIGRNALKLAAVGESSNIAIGHDAMAAVDEGTANGDADHNIAIGQDALTGGDFAGNDRQLQGNIAIGSSAMNSTAANAQTGTIAIGKDALTALTTGDGNVAVGYLTLDANLVGSYNTAIGHESLTTFVADGDNEGHNTALGYFSGRYVSTGTANTFIGSKAGLGLTGTPLTGNDNTAIGTSAGVELEGAAHSNTFVGSGAGNTTDAGVENTCLGHNCLAEDNTATNQIVIGNNVTGVADNAVHIGNDTRHIRCDFGSDQTWDAPSDERIKNITGDSSLGLDFINALPVKTFTWKPLSEYPEEFTSYNADETEPPDTLEHHGLIAQSVKAALDMAGVTDFSGWDEDSDGMQTVGESAFVYPLIKAVQELSAEVEKLKNK